MGMMVGVAVGWALAEELRSRDRRTEMQIKFIGHATFELTDGDATRARRPVPGAQQPGRAGQRRRGRARPTS